MTHAKLSPSASKRWLTCPGSVRLIEALEIEDSPSKYAAEGTVAHQICEECLLHYREPEEYLGKVMEADGFKFTVTEEMIEACKIYVHYIRDYVEQAEITADVKVEVQVEVKCNLKHLGIKGLDGGTSDAVLLTQEHCVLEVVDYKHGSGVLVEPENNTQAMQYALGALKLLENTGEDISCYCVYITIVQPRVFGAEPIRTWKTSAKDLLAWQDSKLVPGALATHDPNAPLKASPEGCMFCPVKDCAERYKATCEAAMIDFEGLGQGDVVAEVSKPPNPELMTAAQKAAVMDNMKLLTTFLKAVEAQVTSEVMAGSEEYPDYKLVESRTQRQLTEEAFDEICSPLLDFLEPDDLYEKKAKGVGALEKMLRAKFKEVGAKDIGKKVSRIMDQVTIKPEGAIVLAPKSDKRKEVQSSAAGDFEGL